MPPRFAIIERDSSPSDPKGPMFYADGEHLCDWTRDARYALTFARHDRAERLAARIGGRVMILPPTTTARKDK